MKTTYRVDLEPVSESDGVGSHLLLSGGLDFDIVDRGSNGRSRRELEEGEFVADSDPSLATWVFDTAKGWAEEYDYADGLFYSYYMGADGQVEEFDFE